MRSVHHIIRIEAQRASVVQPRVLRSAILGLTRSPHVISMNPAGVPSIVVDLIPTVIPHHGRNPVGVCDACGSLPRVAASPQPWASLQNPVGIWGTSNRGCVINRHSVPILHWTGLEAGCVIRHSIPILRWTGLEAQRASVFQPRVLRTLGARPSMTPNPAGVSSIVVGQFAHVIPHHGRNPVGVRDACGSLPRVAASPQPWASLRNPVGIWGSGNHGYVINHSVPILHWTGLEAGCVIRHSIPILRWTGLEAQRASVFQPSGLRTLGAHPSMPPNPAGVPSIVNHLIPTVIPHHGQNPVGVRDARGSLPRVAASPQPWASLRNPVGIWGSGKHGCVINRSVPILRWTGLEAGCVIRHSVPILLLTNLKAQRASVMLPSSLEAQGASVIQPRVRRTLGNEQTQNVFSPNPEGVLSSFGGSWS